MQLNKAAILPSSQPEEKVQVSAAQEMTEPITGNQRDSDVRPESKGSSILFTAAWPLANG